MRYEIIGKIGEGGGGKVYLALQHTDVGVSRKVAVKKIEGAKDKDIGMQIENELNILQKLDHPNIIKVLDAFYEHSSLCIVTEYVEGKTLRELILERGRIPIDKSVFIVSEVLKALDYSWNFEYEGKPMRIIHRDIKPENVILSSAGFVKVVDFGIAKPIDLRTMTGNIIKGTLGYLSPEQVSGIGVDIRSDIFSLGVVLLEMLTGVNPFLKDSVAETLNTICGGTDTLSLSDFGLSESIEKILETALQKDRTKRFSEPSDFHRELLLNCGTSITQRDLREFVSKPGCLDKETVVIKAEPKPSKSETKQQRNRFITPLTISISLAFLSFTVFFYMVKKENNIMNEKTYIPPTESFTEWKEPEDVEEGKGEGEGERGRKKEITEQNKSIIKEEVVGGKESKGVALLDINTNPWSVVWIDGKKVDVTPLNNIRVKEGKHSLVFENEEMGIKKKITVSVLRGERKKILIDLEED